MNIDRALAIIAHGESNSLKDLSEAGQLIVKRLEDYDEMLKGLMSYLSVGGQVIEPIEPDIADKAIRQGIDMLTKPLVAMLDSTRAERDALRGPVRTSEAIDWSLTANEIGKQYRVMAMELAEAKSELERLRCQEPVAYMDSRYGLCWYKDRKPSPETMLYAEPKLPTHPGATHCENCGCTWLDDGLNPVGCPYCKKDQELTV